MAEIEISKIKPFIFISGILSLVLPWIFRVNFLGVVYTVQFTSLIIIDLMYFGLFYLVGLCLNFVFFKYDGHLNYFIGYLSLCLIVIGAIGYFATFYSIVTQLERSFDEEIEIILGPGFYFILSTIFLVCFELYYLKGGNIRIEFPKRKVKKERPVEQPKEKVIKKKQHRAYSRRTNIILNMLLVIFIATLFFIGIFYLLLYV